MRQIKAKTGAYGYAYGNAYFLNTEISVVKHSISDTEAEIRRLDAAIDDVHSILSAAKERADEKSAPIIDAQIAMLKDTTYIERIRNMIMQNRLCAEYSVAESGRLCAEEFETIDNDYLNARATDIRGITSRLVKKLTGREDKIDITEPSVVFAKELTPELVSTIDRSNIVAFISMKGTKTSHVSILCGNYGIPYLFGVDYENEGVDEGTEVAVDAVNAILYLNPDDNTKRTIDDCILLRQNQNLLDADTGHIGIYANIGSAAEAQKAMEAGADGIGLFRTEFLYMGDKLPTEEEQFEVYKSVAAIMGEKPVIIRTMDVGADKESPCVKLAHQDNPALGKRAIRICLDDTQLFKTQLKAVLRAAVYGNIELMYPMITSVAEIKKIEEIINEAACELKERDIPYVIPRQGVMIETPSAAVISDKLAKMVDFFSVGTNDLTQYTLAVDRMAEDLDDYFDPHSEAVMRLIKMVVDNAHKADIRVGVCGELGADEWAVPKLLEAGIDELSMSPAKIKNTKAMVSSYFAKISTTEELKMGVEFIGAPADGEVVEMSQIPDPVFASGMLGKCMGVIPSTGDIYAPCDGKIYMIAQTKHAIGIISDYGNDVLVHVGIDTVTLKGEGFTVLVSENERVTKGMPIMKVNLDVIKKADLSDMVITVVKEEKKDVGQP